MPGHEVACRIVAVGAEVEHHRVGERCLVQTDYRTLATRGANAAFGYNFEGGLQEYVLLDERVVIEPGTGERFLIPVPEVSSASAIALVEPWSCVENAYASVRPAHGPGRRTPAGGRRRRARSGWAWPRLSTARRPGVGGGGHAPGRRSDRTLASSGARPRTPTTYASSPTRASTTSSISGPSAETIEVLNDKLAASGVINIVLGGASIGRRVAVGVGRIHYGLTRWIGTTGASAAARTPSCPGSGELRPNEKVLIVGAAGPMGQMHVIRSLCTPVEGISVVGTDVDDARLEALRRKAEPYARRNGVPLQVGQHGQGAARRALQLPGRPRPGRPTGGGRGRQQRARRPGGHLRRDPRAYPPGDRPRHLYRAVVATCSAPAARS